MPHASISHYIIHTAIAAGYGAFICLALANERKDDWLLHIDPDELFYPDNAAFSLADEFAKQPSHVSSLRFMNFEGQPEFGDVQNRLALS